MLVIEMEAKSRNDRSAEGIATFNGYPKESESKKGEKEKRI